MASKVAVIMGGTSFERNFSLLSGRLVSESLARSGFDVLTLDADAHLVDTLRAEKPDVAFICMHGAGGEDGAVPALLEFLLKQINPYPVLIHLYAMNTGLICRKCLKSAQVAGTLADNIVSGIYKNAPQ